jgi:hypothetical protein
MGAHQDVDGIDLQQVEPVENAVEVPPARCIRARLAEALGRERDPARLGLAQARDRARGRTREWG